MRRSVPPSTSAPVAETSRGTAAAAPAASVVAGELTKDRSFDALYMNQRAPDDASGAAATGCAAKPALKYGVGALAADAEAASGLCV